jgi:hypothetical protein
MNDQQAFNSAACGAVPISPQYWPFMMPIAVLTVLAAWLHRALAAIILLPPRILIVGFFRKKEWGTPQSKGATVVVKNSVYKPNVHMEDHVSVGSTMLVQRKEHSHA